MFQNYIRIAIRNFYRNKVFVLINALGLGMALACCIVAYLNYGYGKGFNLMHEHKEQIHKISITKNIEGEQVKYGITPITLGPMIEAEMSEMVDAVVRYNRNTDALKYGDKIINQQIGYADKEFFEVFSYSVVAGSIENFQDPTQMIITQKMANAFFGDLDPLGERLTLITPDGNQFGFTVGAVIQDLAQNNSLQFDGIVLFQNLMQVREIEELDWKNWTAATFLYMQSDARITDVNEMLQKYVSAQNTSRPDWEVASYYTTPLLQMAAEARDIRANWLWPEPHPAAIYAPAVMAILILLIACFNFTNTSISLAGKRLKEIGIRKVVGGTRKQLAFQFLTESLFLTSIAILVSLAIANYLVPGYSSLWIEMGIEMNLSSDPNLWAFLGIILVGTAGLSGGYPAFYVSRLKPVGILKGTQRFGGVNRLSKILLTLQFGISLMALLAGIAFVQNALYQKKKGLGYDHESVIGVPVRNYTQAEVLVNAIQGNSDIQILGTTDDHIGRNDWSMVIKGKDEKVAEVHVFDVGVNYLEAMSLPLNSGRTFNLDQEAVDRESSVLVNRILVEQFGWNEPLGQTITYQDTIQKTIIGVVENFSTYGYFVPMQPTMIRMMPQERTRLVVVKTELSKLNQVNAFLEKQWLTVNPTAPYEGFYQDEQVASSLETNNNIVLIFSFLAVVSLLMSSVGLFTLVSLSILKRIKELGVRKVLGATVANLATLINRQFVIILLVASVIGSAGGFFFTDSLMSSIYVDYVEINWFSIAAPVLLMILVAGLTISGKVYRAATRNPVESLRYE